MENRHDQRQALEPRTRLRPLDRPSDRPALRKVQEAFYQDTADINAHDNCLLLNIDDIRKLVGKK